jgi:hypothetical protein
MNFPFIYNDYVGMMGTVSILKKDKKESRSLLTVASSPSLLSLNGRRRASFLRCPMLLQGNVVHHKANDCPYDGRDHPS